MIPVGVMIMVSSISIAVSFKSAVEIATEAVVWPAGIVTVVADNAYSVSVVAVPESAKSKEVSNTDTISIVNVKVTASVWFSSIELALSAILTTGRLSILLIVTLAGAMSLSLFEVAETVNVSSFSYKLSFFINRLNDEVVSPASILIFGLFKLNLRIEFWIPSPLL